MTAWHAIGAGCLVCAITACGGNAPGATGGSGGSGGAGGTGGVSRVCGLLCVSPCTADLAGLPEDTQTCFDECAATPVYEACSTPTIAFLDCLEENGCGEPAAEECQVQSIQFGQCLTLPPD